MRNESTILIGANVWSPIAQPDAPPPTTASPVLLVDTRDAARMLAISERTLWGRTAPRGPIPVLRFGRAVRYAIADLASYVASGREVAP